MKNSPIIIVAGDPRSVFLEIFFKSIKYKNYKSPLILICSKKILLQHMKKNKLKKKINILDYKEIKTLNLDNKSINLIDIRLEKNNSNKYIHQSFELAFYLVKNKFSYKFINGPINKKSFLQKKFLGITEFISHRFKSKNMGMLIYNKNLSVSPITTHVPIKLVTKYISKKIIENKIKIIDEFFRRTLKYKPKIGVTGLNPHCESVSTFSEEDKIITPAIRSQKKRGVDVKGPFSADTIFLKKNRKKFNVIIGMYHDQVLTPIKTLFEFDAINITMGLPFMRLSPDHGPNEKMVGKKISNPLSLVRAIEFLDSK
jgi:4-hydroxy-L-threonine phosphate dehydrogenase PdxA